MQRPTNNQREKIARTMSRRALFLSGGMAGLMALLGTRMWQIGVRDSAQYALLAEENRVRIRLVPPDRGRILDRSGIALAENKPRYRVSMIPEEIADAKATLASIGRLFTLTEEEKAKVLAKMERVSGYSLVTVKDGITWEELALVAVNGPALPGVYPEMAMARSYPFGPDYAHQVGYVGPVSESDIAEGDGTDPLLKVPDYQIGKIGIERAYEDALRGKPGLLRLEVNSRGRTIRELGTDPATSGPDLRLTLDHHLQNFMRVRLEGQSAAAVVLDATNGDVLGCVSAPSYDPNLFVDGISRQDYGALRDNEFRPLADKTVQGAYPPGSTIKMSMALAALEAKAVDPQETVTCNSFIEISGRRFHCWKKGGHGKVNLIGALRESCDVFFYTMAQRIGIDGISAMNDRLGLGQKFDLPLSGMAKGINPSRDWKQQKYQQEWLIGDTINASIGQGYTAATPMQLATMVARVASGRAITPRFVRPADGSEAVAPPLGVAAANLALVHQGLFEVSNSERGTAYASRIADPALAMAGKTGSSQVFSITAEERAAGVRSQAELPWNRRDHALFTAFAPFDNPRFAMVVVVEHGGGGSTAAAPIARDIMLFAQNGALPSEDSYPLAERNRVREDLTDLASRILPPDDPATPPRKV